MNRIAYGRLRSLTVRELISALLRDGFSLDRVRMPLPILPFRWEAGDRILPPLQRHIYAPAIENHHWQTSQMDRSGPKKAGPIELKLSSHTLSESLDSGWHAFAGPLRSKPSETATRR